MSFCLPHAVAFNDFMVCNDVYVFDAMLTMCVLYYVGLG